MPYIRITRTEVDSVSYNIEVSEEDLQSLKNNTVPDVQEFLDEIFAQQDCTPCNQEPDEVEDWYLWEDNEYNVYDIESEVDIEEK